VKFVAAAAPSFTDAVGCVVLVVDVVRLGRYVRTNVTERNVREVVSGTVNVSVEKVSSVAAVCGPTTPWHAYSTVFVWSAI